MSRDRTDEIRAAILRARMVGWAARLEVAETMLATSDEDGSLARAVIGDVVREMRPS